MLSSEIYIDTIDRDENSGQIDVGVPALANGIKGFTIEYQLNNPEDRKNAMNLAIKWLKDLGVSKYTIADNTEKS